MESSSAKLDAENFSNANRIISDSLGEADLFIRANRRTIGEARRLREFERLGIAPELIDLCAQVGIMGKFRRVVRSGGFQAVTSWSISARRRRSPVARSRD